MLLSPASALLTLALSTGALSASPPRPIAWEPDVHRIELPADAAGTPPEVRVTPGLTTTLLFDTPIVLEGVRLEGCERCRVSPARDALTLVPQGALHEGQRLRLTVPFADGAAPASADFLLVVHPVAQRQVEVFRQRRTVDSLRAELKEQGATVRRCQEELAQVRSGYAETDGLTGLLSSGRMGKGGIPSEDIWSKVTARPGNALLLKEAVAYRATDRVALTLKVSIPKGAGPWTAAGARLVGPEGELRGLTVWQAAPISPDASGRLVVEADATEGQTRGPFTLTLWDADGRRSVAFAHVTFP